MAPAVNVEDLTGRETSIITLTLVALSTVVVLVRVGATLGRHKHLFADDCKLGGGTARSQRTVRDTF